MRTNAHALIILGTLLAFIPSVSAQEPVARERETIFHLSGSIGTTAAFGENTMLAAAALDARFYAREGLGAIVRLGYEGLLYLNFGVLDVAVAYRAEVPSGEWAALGLGFGLGVSAMIRDSVYQFTGDDAALALFGTLGLDVRLGSLILGLDAIGRWQMVSGPILGVPTREHEWAEIGGAIRIGGEVVL